MVHYFGCMGHYFGWVGVDRKIFWVGGGELGWVHCLIMPKSVASFHFVNLFSDTASLLFSQDL